MRKLLFLFVLLVAYSCAERKNSPEEQVKIYFDGFKNADYVQIKSVIADSLSITEGDYVMPFTTDSFYEHFKWDSVFKPDYQLIEIEMENGQPIVTASVKSLRFKFLKNNPLVCKHRFHFTSEKISKIENLDCPSADWEIWQKERDSLVNWVKMNHPELDGFINDLSEKGAINYMKAIKLYKEAQIDMNP